VPSPPHCHQRAAGDDGLVRCADFGVERPFEQYDLAGGHEGGCLPDHATGEAAREPGLDYSVEEDNGVRVK